MQIDQSTPSPNHEPRDGQPITLIVLHATVGNLQSARDWLTSPASKVSTHYLISKAGMIAQLVPEELAAWHAGRSEYGELGSEGVKLQSIGIELENRNDGKDPYPHAQLDALRELVADIRARHPAVQIVTHAEIARPRGRKTDPKNFPMGALGLYTEDSPLIGTPRTNSTSVIQDIQLFHQRRRAHLELDQPKYPDVTSLLVIIGQYFEVCAPVGLNTDLAIAQMLHETGWLTSDWCARPRRNPAGIGVNGTKQQAEPLDTDGWAFFGGLWRMGLSFENWYRSVNAHAGRLLAYALPFAARTALQQALIETALAYRPLPPKVHGSAPTLKQLGKAHNRSGRGWATPGTTYGLMVARTANQIGGA